VSRHGPFFRFQQGTALLVALVTMLVLTMSLLLAAALVQVGVDSFDVENRRLVTTALADAAMAEALASIDEDPRFPGSAERRFGGGVISSRVEQTAPERRRVVAVGRIHGYRTVVSAEVELDFGRPRVMRWRYRSGS